MPDPPSVSFVTRYVLENPWPLAVALAAIAGVMIWIGVREGLWRRARIGGAVLLVAAGIAAAGWLIETVGETGARIARQFVEAVVAEDVAGATQLLVAEGGTFNTGSPNNPGQDLAVVRDHVRGIARDYNIESNRITMLRGYGETRDRAIVHLGCMTEVEGGYGLTVTQWVLRVEQQPDDSWKITRLTWISMNNGPAPSRIP